MSLSVVVPANQIQLDFVSSSCINEDQGQTENIARAMPHLYRQHQHRNEDQRDLCTVRRPPAAQERGRPHETQEGLCIRFIPHPYRCDERN